MTCWVANSVPWRYRIRSRKSKRSFPKVLLGETMSYEAYKILHLMSIFAIFAVLGGQCVYAINGGSRATNRAGKLNAIILGVALLVAIMAGFGLLARLNLTTGIPGWVWAKLIIWLLVAFYAGLPFRYPALAKPLLIALPFLGLAAAWLAISKPF